MTYCVGIKPKFHFAADEFAHAFQGLSLDFGFGFLTTA
jgi:hypothetical protein